ncbi:hypothetical protein BKA67DRAFT_575842 [Truncatella angustata]|uniref:FAD-binding domain-containing protein n=1 Tax=Truncatella angustata TaxID=152316 RepID=A0A9P8UF77_9PEZI|nr:uncharacterized protein BKA67DRAFT_575842 [Truncatella angustata]KAH6648799.1 hypothetical protein BKA67DRAFT_575842 [Truncatella angustata]KAH8200863.1 hypothetical protein TruAng_004949 [Truncatella angustata]
MLTTSLNLTTSFTMRVLISGAGIAGSTLAWFLANTGSYVTIVEKSQSLLPHGQNVDLKGDAITIIRKMGLMEQLRQFNTTEEGTQFVDSKGQPFARFPVKEGYLNSFTSEFEILRGDLAMLLYEATKGHPNANYLFGTTVREVLSNDEAAAKVELSNGEVREFDLIVAADGQWSKLRKQCFHSADVHIVHLGMYSAYYTIPRIPSDNDWWNIFLGLESRTISLRPDPHGSIRAMFTRMPRNDAQENVWLAASKSGRLSQIELLKGEFADAGWQAQRLLDAIDQAPDFYFHVIEQIQMSRWSNGRVVCLGDTAYAPSPLTGMGTSLAMIGAYVLAGELSSLGEGESPAKALQTYETKLRPFVADSQKIPFFVPGIAHPEAAWTRWLYQSIGWALSKAAGFRWLANKFPDVESQHDNFRWPEYQKLDA